MTTIAGAVSLDAQPADRALAERMLGAMAHRGGAAAVQCSGGAAIGGRHRGPVTNPGGLLVAFHGVLYDGEALATELATGSGADAAGLVAAAYARWGVDCASRLNGDFAFALWDPRASRLVAARDVVGIKPFYYAVAGRTFLFASELHALFAHPALARRPNEGAIAELLCDQVTTRSETLFDGIFRLPPAHTLVACGGTLEIRRHWSPRARSSSQVLGDDEYAEGFRDVFRRSVARRVAGQRRVAIQLSGGVDSTAVTAMAVAVCGPAAVTAFSNLHAGPGCDEREHIAAATRALGIESRLLDAPAPHADWVHDETSRYLDWAGGPNGEATDAGMYRAAIAAGFAVMLTGEGGDEWFSGSPSRYADYVAAGDVRSIGRELRGARSFSTACHRLAFAGVWPVLPAWFRRAAWAVAGRRAGGPRLAPWLTPAFARRTAIDDRRRRPEYDPGSGLTRASWTIAQALTDGWQAIAFEATERALAAHGLEERHPFYDVDVIEFALSLPEPQRYQTGESKRVVRRALAGLMPESIRVRADKAEYSSLYVQAFAAQGGERMFDRLAIADEGWVRPDELRRALARAHQALARNQPTGDLRVLWTVLAIDRWYRHAILRQPLATSRHDGAVDAA